MGTSSPELGEVLVRLLARPLDVFCSGEESVDVERSRVVELTLGEKAENGLCQFMVSCVVQQQWVCVTRGLCLSRAGHDRS